MTASQPEAPAKPFRLLPQLDDRNRAFWTGGADGALRLWRCDDCGYWIHPPSPRCPRCLSTALSVTEASGEAVVHTFTVNHQPWIPGLDPPYVVAIVELADQPGLRLTTSLVGIEPDEVTIGMPVRVTFEQYDDVWLPFFTPVTPITPITSLTPSMPTEASDDAGGGTHPEDAP